DKRSGGSVWTAGSYDGKRNLAFFGPAPTYDTGPLRDSIAKRGTTNDALYTNATIALNPDTGKLAWFFQHVPNDQWDFDWAFERQLLTLPINGRDREVLVTSGKEALYDALELDGVLATAGGLVFAGALDRYFTAYDAASGKALWRSRLTDVPSAAPITYAVNGRQYVAMVVGYGSPQTMTFPMLTPEIDLPIVRSS